LSEGEQSNLRDFSKLKASETTKTGLGSEGKKVEDFQEGREINMTPFNLQRTENERKEPTDELNPG